MDLPQSFFNLNLFVCPKIFNTQKYFHPKFLKLQFFSQTFFWTQNIFLRKTFPIFLGPQIFVIPKFAWDPRILLTPIFLLSQIFFTQMLFGVKFFAAQISLKTFIKFWRSNLQPAKLVILQVGWGKICKNKNRGYSWP